MISNFNICVSPGVGHKSTQTCNGQIADYILDSFVHLNRFIQGEQ
ncbi:hypothetical protein M23134_08401 [Microscilla marina ATCC 23134]|uniref:Uncharacterized protein n=1 Tax=Microscilla marina ATCC 23134 TaxID=313606 RepID=A1ZR38_MICM2|nr:hypothetical protein M23134_08401 [Microscilla marina ATCC 23134]